jgi:hypothetical protein
MTTESSMTPNPHREAGHTPGPWHWDEVSSSVIADALDGGYSNCVASYVYGADAHLIAAAPKLHDLIRESLYHLRLDDGAKGYHERVLAVLKEIRGESA